MSWFLTSTPGWDQSLEASINIHGQHSSPLPPCLELSIIQNFLQREISLQAVATATQDLQMEDEEKHRAPDFVDKLPAAGGTGSALKRQL